MNLCILDVGEKSGRDFISHSKKMYAFACCMYKYMLWNETDRHYPHNTQNNKCIVILEGNILFSSRRNESFYVQKRLVRT